MTEPMIRVVVAPGRRVQIDPHPSGLAGMAPLYVDAGEGLTVSEGVADRLYDRGQVLHPQTGQPRPAQTFGTPPLVANSSETFESLAARADAERVLEPVRAPHSSAVDGWRDHVSIEPQDPNTAEQIINVGERRWQWCADRAGRLRVRIDMAHLLGAPRRKAAAIRELRADRGQKSRNTPDDKRDDQTEADYEERRREQRPNETVSEYRERKRRDEQTDPDEDDEADASARAARIRERARGAAILGSKAAGSRPDMAAHFAFATDMSPQEAIAALRQIAAGTPPPRHVPRRESFCARMDRQRSPQLGNGFAAEAPDASTPDGLARQILAAAGMPVKRKGQQQ